MFELLLIALGGLLGSSHCVGMCGGFALSIGMGATTWKSLLQRQLIYSLGRVFTYGFLGIMAGFAGIHFAERIEARQFQIGLSVLAGVLLICSGLNAGGWLRWRRILGKPDHKPCLSATFFSAFLRSPNRLNVFIAGLLTGLLPCGLVYAYLALAAGSGRLFTGGLIMLAFGLGTIPLMVLTGSGGILLSHLARQRVLKAAAICVIFTGSLAIWRGIQAGSFFSSDSPLACPMCRE